MAHTTSRAAVRWRVSRRIAAVALVALLGGLSLGAGDRAHATPAGQGDHCTFSPDKIPGVFNFISACDQHDACYAQKPYGATVAGRERCDTEFYAAMLRSCHSSRCRALAGTYFSFVRSFGALFFFRTPPAPSNLQLFVFQPCAPSATQCPVGATFIDRSQDETSFVALVWSDLVGYFEVRLPPATGTDSKVIAGPTSARKSYKFCAEVVADRNGTRSTPSNRWCGIIPAGGRTIIPVS